jgi:hypothetical protein
MATYEGMRCWLSSVGSSNPMSRMYHSDISEFMHYSELKSDAVHNFAAAGRCLGSVVEGLLPYTAGSTSEMDE